jgi:5-methylcytosine-specific restriction protein A
VKVKICNYPGCNNLIQPSEKYCANHKNEPASPFSSAIRYNEELYQTARWRSLRKKILKEQSHCLYCGSTECLQVHHVVPPRGNEELFFNENNLIVVCAACHRIITNREIGKRQREIK